MRDGGSTDAAFRPGAVCGQTLSQEEYYQRRDSCTVKKLNELVTSAEYKQWIKNSSKSSTVGTWTGVALCGLLLLVLLLASQPWILNLELVSLLLELTVKEPSMRLFRLDVPRLLKDFERMTYAPYSFSSGIM